ncbi:hypothetical protein [Aequorivita lipolytica]|uniref:Uncharacterized protein n=1 Tax=Aequorivita lipolytica TaxID=153267 RepID=A0A5C6YNG4_9FLAO|nr:hypothetical protein [Aequorivita lipolytica]TXD68848.1 hypothetical protein ESV24_10370 [Aequorivita lipolytica]SRX52107.1 hypothetical protein AEQU2_02086 [Aequorivita lipolytica]
MEQTEFLEKNIFTDLKNLNDGSDKETIQYFSEQDFEIVLQRVEHFGIGVYKIETWQNGEVSEVAAHEDFKKKATDPKWYKKAFLTFKSRQPGLSYSATYKVSNKLLAKNTALDNEELS